MGLLLLVEELAAFPGLIPLPEGVERACMALTLPVSLATSSWDLDLLCVIVTTAHATYRARLHRYGLGSEKERAQRRQLTHTGMFHEEGMRKEDSEV